MKKVIALCSLILLYSICNAQKKHGKVWVTGGGISYKIKFENTGIINNYLDTFYSPYFTHGNSNICDSNGNLILCSDGYNIYDSNANYIDGGDTLVPKAFYINQDGWSALSQSSIFLPMDSDMYYFITPAMGDARYADCQTNNHCYFDLLLYNVIDMKANAGAGKVVKRMQPLMENAELRKTQMMACRHGNGKDWWLLKNEGDNANMHTFLFTQDSVYDKGMQVFNEPVWGNWDLTGQSTFNSDGNMFATTSHGSSTGKIFIADFDRCWGVLSNHKEIIMPIGSQHIPSDTTIIEHLSVGLAFSPNGKFLYVISMSNIYQYDLQDSTWFHVAGLDTSYQKFQYYATAYLGQDDKLYIGNDGGLSKQMSRIDNPDIKGAGCNFCPRCLRLDSVFYYGGVGTPPCMPNYALGARECYPLATHEVEGVQNEIDVYPNPVSTKLYIHSLRGTKWIYQLYNSVGQLILSTKENEIDVSRFAKGIYYLKFKNAVKKVIIE